ncbi:MAG: 4-hydroxybutyrate CoA-transferase [Epulopiscium sp. Nuni2H_MBin003]|nr:MAG: 4-hydroxybutyrate CoA-transferase [Epulopiscium sp. Nuni2H_MBin003]
MEDIKELYTSKLVTSDEAALKIKSNDRVFFGHAVAEPTTLIEALVRNKEEFSNVEICHLVYLGNPDYVLPENKEHFRNNSLFAGAATRKPIAENRADFTPMYFSEIPGCFRDGYIPLDVYAFQCAPPDENGYVNLGVSVDYALAGIETAKTVIAEVNDRVPRVGGAAQVHISEIDYIIESNKEIFEIKPPVIGEVEKKIGAYIADLIPDGATLQLGIGSMPDAILTFLHEKKDLGIHTEMLSDGVIDLIESGVINGSQKNINKGKVVTTFIMGTRRLYDFVDGNPMIEAYPVDYTNNPYNIAKNDNVIAVNACIQVDLMGQVVSDCIGTRQFSGVGGQVDFVRGARLSKGGKAIIAIGSTTADGKISKIVPFLDHGAAVTTSRTDVDYIVTEYGVARLRGKCLRERAKLLIDIAHPKFRDSLMEEFNKRFPS